MAATGNIVVFTGIIPVAKDEDGLAAILGHGLFLAIGLVPFSANQRHRDCPCGSAAQCGEVFIYEGLACICNSFGGLRGRCRNCEASHNILP